MLKISKDVKSTVMLVVVALKVKLIVVTQEVRLMVLAVNVKLIVVILEVNLMVEAVKVRMMLVAVEVRLMVVVVVVKLMVVDLEVRLIVVVLDKVRFPKVIVLKCSTKGAGCGSCRVWFLPPFVELFIHSSLSAETKRKSILKHFVQNINKSYQ